MKIKNQLLLIITIFGLLSCKKNIQDKDIATKYNVKYNLSGIYINDVLQTVESNNFNIDFYSIMNNDSFKIKSYLYFNKLNNYNLIYIQNNTQDTAFFFKFNENRFSNKGVRFVKKDDSLLLSNIMINDSTYNYYVLKTYNLGKLNFRNNNPINLRVANTSNDDLEKDIDNAIKYFGQTPLITWIKDKSDEIKNKADEIGDWIIESVNDIIKYNTTDPKDINNSNLSQNEINDHNNVKNQIKNKFNETDCMGLTNGAAVIDDCGFCSGGTSGNSANIDKDCNGDCHGTARLDDCGICVEGNTGKAPCSNPTVTDIDGNEYDILTIGTQKWMTSNLKTTRYNDGNPIPNITDDIQWRDSLIDAYCYLYDDSTYIGWGVLYNFKVVETNKICPTGWHVPSETEWSQITSTYQFYFKGPGSFKNYYNGVFSTSNYYDSWWSSTTIDIDNSYLFSGDGNLSKQSTNKKNGVHIRCIKD